MANTAHATTPISLAENGDRPIGPIGQWVLTPVGLQTSRMLLLVTFLFAWEQISLTYDLRFWISRPTAIGSTIWNWTIDGTLWRNVEATLIAMSIGYVIGCSVGLVCGVLLGVMVRLQRVLSPFITAVYVLPKIAIAPLLIIFFGLGLESKIALASITVFFVVLYNTIGGVRDVDKDVQQSVRLMGGSQLEVIRHVLLPASMPWIYTGMRLGVRQAFTATVLAEIIGANRGLGYLIEVNAGLYNTTGVFAAVIVLTVIAVFLTEVVTRIETRAQSSRK